MMILFATLHLSFKPNMPSHIICATKEHNFISGDVSDFKFNMKDSISHLKAISHNIKCGLRVE